jgi:hypothetical protein
MRVRFGRYQNGDHYARTTVPILGGEVTITARITAEELRRMYADNIGFRLSFKSLGKAIKAMARPATLLKVTTLAAAIVANPAVAAKVGVDLANSVKRGMAAKRVLTLAATGDTRAQSIVAKAKKAAQTGTTATVPGIDAGVMKYLVTVQRLRLAA